MNETKICCPKCYGTQLHSGMRGYNWWRGGIFGSASIRITCLACGHQFKPGQGGTVRVGKPVAPMTGPTTPREAEHHNLEVAFERPARTPSNRKALLVCGITVAALMVITGALHHTSQVDVAAGQATATADAAPAPVPDSTSAPTLGVAASEPASASSADAASAPGISGMQSSETYADRARRRVRPYIEWDGPSSGLETKIAIHCAPSGTVLSATVQRGSGNPQWDAAALKAVQSADPMPTDSDGRAPAAFAITLRPAG
ncbi:hypothetical protein LMG28727_00831 [Paraburkholderia kirstenboschensis]|uniref:energy transducer TonB n=1 Tax=Paraburkholderia kirstenboschensis TaxID=1245436 RepID=UPI000AA6166D|nr:energy transducer TonB [Paraburkholderia kirstenboschensis]CAD6514074.1 hypothetical protein LMG28727_00831 [Paraburkholderia kirstenboschensis]